MDGASEITRGAIESIFKTGKAVNHPVVQVTDLKRISNGTTPGSSARYRLAISDGTHFQQAMIATQLNFLITENRIQVNSLVRLMEIICNAVQDKCIVIILSVQVVGNLSMRVGNPVSIDLVMNPKRGTPPVSNNPGVPANPAGVPHGHPQTHPGGPQFPQQPALGSRQTDMQTPTNLSGARFTPSDDANLRTPAGNNQWSGQAARPNPFAGHGSSGAISRMHSAPSQFRPIQSINPYQNGWTIHGRCTFKADMRKYQNARGEGQVISFELTDESGSIRITGFSQIAQRIEEIVHLNRLYKVSKGSLKPANEQYNRSTSSFEMTIDQSSVLEEEVDDGSTLQVKFKFVRIADLGQIEVKGMCDVVGIVTAVGPLSEVMIRSTGEPCARRSITITDDSNASVELTLWRKQAESFITEDGASSHPVLLMRNAVRQDFGGVSLNVGRLSSLELNPVGVPEANRLRSWFDNGGMSTANVQSVTASAGGSGGAITGPRKTLLQAKLEDVDPTFTQNSSDASVTYVTRGLVTFVNTKNDLYYPGDPETKKKVINNGNGTWTSESTGKMLSDDQVVWRYVVSMKIADHSSSNWVSAFDEVGPILFGKSALQMRELKDSNPNMFDHVVEEAMCRPFLFKITAKERVWRDDTQIRYTIGRAEPMNFASEGRVLLQEIQSFVSK